MSLAGVLLALCGSPGCVAHHEPIPWDAWRHTYPAHYDMPLGEKAASIERHLLERHLSPEGLLVYWRRATPFDPSLPDSYGYLSDQTMWTGTLVGAWAFKYAETGSPEDRQTLLRICRGLKLLHDVTGKPGLFARSVVPRSVPVPEGGPAADISDAVAPFDEYRYWGSVSKDQYFGVLFGCAAAAIELGIHARGGDAEIRDVLASVVVPVADHIWENGLRIVDVDGATTEHGDLTAYFFGIPIGPNAALTLGFELLAHRLTGEPRFRTRYDKLVRRRYPKATSNVKFEIFGQTNHNNDNMGMLGLYALANLDSVPANLSHYHGALSKLWGYTRNEGNALFHLVYATRFELPGSARHDLVENLRLYPVDLRQFPIDVRRYPQVEESFFANRFGISKSRTALPLHLRTLTSFIWTDCPFALTRDVGHPGEFSVSGVDFLVAYWMARRYLWGFEEPPDDASTSEPPGASVPEAYP